MPDRKMDFTRTHITASNSMLGSLRGTYEPTEGCNGAFISQERGMDGMCCARCHILRQQIYAKKGVFISNPITLRLMEELKRQGLNPCSACVVSFCHTNLRCGSNGIEERKHDSQQSTALSNPLLFVPPSSSELKFQAVEGGLKKQFQTWKELKIVDPVIDLLHISYTQSGMPIVFPSEQAVQLSEFKGDEGVLITDDSIQITDEKLAYQSGKWWYLICYYKVIKLLYNQNERMKIF